MPGAVQGVGTMTVTEAKIPAFGKLAEQTENKTVKIINKGIEAKTRRKIKQGKGDWSPRVGSAGKRFFFHFRVVRWSRQTTLLKCHGAQNPPMVSHLTQRKNQNLTIAPKTLRDLDLTHLLWPPLLLPSP